METVEQMDVRIEVMRTLTQRMENVISGLEMQFVNLLNRLDFERKINALRKCKRDEAASIQLDLIEMFRQCGYTGEIREGSAEYYEALLNKCEIPAPERLPFHMYERLFQEYKRNPFPMPQDYLSRIVKKKIDSSWANDPLRLQILKVFLHDADALKAAGFTSNCVKQYAKCKTGLSLSTWDEVIENLDDDVFAELMESRDKIKGRSRLALLKICNDLANGIFGNPNVTREEIYLFSAVFDLTFYGNNAERLRRPENDIEQVMFGDYYSNNIMRYITEHGERIRKGGEIKYPVGSGINFKNYLEVIFLFFLCQNLPAREKLEKIYGMAGRLYERWQQSHKNEQKDKNTNLQESQSDELEDKSTHSQEGQSGERLSKSTHLYEREIRLFASGTEEGFEEFEEFVAERYNCSKDPKSSDAFGIDKEQNTTGSTYKKLLKDAAEWFGKDFSPRGLVFFDDVLDKETIDVHVDPKTLDAKGQFNVLLYEIDRDLIIIPGFNAPERETVTRADFLKAYYQLYLLINIDENRYRSFADSYEDFSSEANLYLREARLTPIDGRNLYDLLLIFSAYCIINEEKFEV